MSGLVGKTFWCGLYLGFIGGGAFMYFWLSFWLRRRFSRGDESLDRQN